MSHHHQLAATTRTLELRQVEEINQRLGEPGQTEVTASMLGLDGAQLPASSFPKFELFLIDSSGPQTLPPLAVLDHVWAEGTPGFPYLMGYFRTQPAELDVPWKRGLVVSLHTDALGRLSRQLRLRHCWGSDAVAVYPS
jgi:hypothetical protein